MEVEGELSVVGDVCLYSPRGKVSLVEAVELVTVAITGCRVRSVRKLLVDTSGLFGFANPSFADRYWMVQDWAHAADGELILALVTLPDYIHPGKFGVKAAADAGLKGDVFPTVAEAVAWLAANDVPPRAPRQGGFALRP